MLIYIGLFFALLLGAFFTDKLQLKNKNKIYCFYAAIILIVVSSLRNNIGVDFVNYRSAYNALVYQNDFGDFEPGYILLELACYHIFIGFRGVIIFTSILIQGITVYMIYKESPNSIFSICIYIMLGYFYSSLNQIRLYCAISIFLVALPYVRKRQFKKFCFWTILAASFHFTALGMIPLYFLLNSRSLVRHLIVITLCSISALFLVNYIIDIGIKIFPKYSYYIHTHFNNGYGIKSLHRVFLIVLPQLMFWNMQKTNQKKQFYLKCGVYALVISLFQLQFQLFERFALYLSMPAACFGWPILIETFKQYTNRKYLSIAMISFLLIYQWYLWYRGWMGVFPYVSVFN